MPSGLRSVRVYLTEPECAFVAQVGDLVPGSYHGLSGGTRWCVGYVMRQFVGDRARLVSAVLGPVSGHPDGASGAIGSDDEIVDAEVVS
jgi:hypothetical protein